MANPVVWFEVLGEDADKLRSFYGELLGWEFEVQPDANYGMVKHEEGQIGGGIGQAAPDQPGWSTFYTQVPDLLRAIEKARSLGSRVLMPITELPDTTIAVVTDPDGRAVGLCTPNRQGH